MGKLITPKFPKKPFASAEEHDDIDHSLVEYLREVPEDLYLEDGHPIGYTCHMAAEYIESLTEPYLKGHF